MDKALSYLALARKAGLIELGEEPVGAITRAGKAALVIVSSDASGHTWRRAKSFVAGTEQQCLKLPFTKAEVGMAVGRQELAIGAITDPALAVSFAQALPDGAAKAVLPALEEKALRQKKRRQEARAHQRNVRKGKKQD